MAEDARKRPCPTIQYSGLTIIFVDYAVHYQTFTLPPQTGCLSPRKGNFWTDRSYLRHEASERRSTVRSYVSCMACHPHRGSEPGRGANNPHPESWSPASGLPRRKKKNLATGRQFVMAMQHQIRLFVRAAAVLAVAT